MKQSIMFHSADELREWFRENHKSVPGLWIRLKYEPAEGDLTQEEALHTAICFGWVDDRIKRIDDTFYRKKFIPRREGSPWSEEHKTIARDLEEKGLMEKAGQDAVAQAKLDGSWNSSSNSPATDAMLEQFTAVLRPHEPAFSNFLRLPPASQRTYAINYCTAKREDTRARRLSSIVEKLSADAIPRNASQKRN